ncbi:MAG TPA: sensor histidine kinase, partial [Enterovirga sp.]
RTRNLIAVVSSLASKTADEAVSLDDFGERFGTRLAALSRVQGLLSHLTAGQRVSFDELLGSELSALGTVGDGKDKVTLDGPPGVSLRSGTVQTFALALHELATNAIKYGALSAPTGRLAVRWRVEADGKEPRLHVDWRESGVDMPINGAPPQGSGYGRQLIERALPYQLKAQATYHLGVDGVHCTIAVPIESGGTELEG